MKATRRARTFSQSSRQSNHRRSKPENRIPRAVGIDVHRQAKLQRGRTSMMANCARKPRLLPCDHQLLSNRESAITGGMLSDVVEDDEILARVASALTLQEDEDADQFVFEASGAQMTTHIRPGALRLTRLSPKLVLLTTAPTALDLRMLSMLGFRSVLNLAPECSSPDQQALVESRDMKYRYSRYLSPIYTLLIIRESWMLCQSCFHPRSDTTRMDACAHPRDAQFGGSPSKWALQLRHV
jgi:hypothetical protein